MFPYLQPTTLLLGIFGYVRKLCLHSIEVEDQDEDDSNGDGDANDLECINGQQKTLIKSETDILTNSYKWLTYRLWYGIDEVNFELGL